MARNFPPAEFYEDSPRLLEKPADILVLAGPGRSITEKNVDSLKIKLIAEGANIAYTNNELRNTVCKNGIISIPGIIANSGGVISSYEEWMLENEGLISISLNEKWDRVKSSIKQRITRNICELCEKIKMKPCLDTYSLALELADERKLKSKNEDRQLRKHTKLINSMLEKKYAIYTK